MSNQLPMAIEPSIDGSQCNFIEIKLNNNHLYFNDFLIETTHRLIESKIAIFLGLDEMLIQESAQTINLYNSIIHGRCHCIKGLTVKQVLQLLQTTNNPRAEKYKPILLNLIQTQVLPLFKQNHDDLPKEKTIMTTDLLTQSNEPLTMSSQEIADLLECRHDNVKRTIDTLVAKGVIQLPQTEEREYINGLGKKQKAKCYMVNKRDSYVVVAQLSPEFTARLVDRWQELENKMAAPAIPQTLPDALRLAADLAETNSKLQLERDEAVRSRHLLDDKRTASAMAKAANLSIENKKLKAQLNKTKGYATILAIQSWLAGITANGKKLANYCRKMGLEVRFVDDVRFGRVNSYPAQAWQDVYNVNIHQVLGV